MSNVWSQKTDLESGGVAELRAAESPAGSCALQPGDSLPCSGDLRVLSLLPGPCLRPHSVLVNMCAPFQHQTRIPAQA